MKTYIKTYEDFNNQNQHLIIIDVQKSFRQFVTEMYLHELNKYCETFVNVYQIWDNHVEGKNIDDDFLYDRDPSMPVNGDLYFFPNQKKLIEKRYNYNVDVDFYKKILDDTTYKIIKDKESNKQLKKGDIFKTTEGTHIIYIGNNHIWFHIPKKLFNLFSELKGQRVVFVGGSMGECFEDVLTAAEIMGIDVKEDFKYIYSATHCPIS